MRKFYFEDKEKRSAYLGIMPSNEVNLLPFQHYRCGLAESFYMILSQLKSDSEWIPENVMRQTALGQTDRYISKLLLKAKRKPEIQKLLVDDSLSYKEQNKLLNGLTLTPEDIVLLNLDAQVLGFLLDIYQKEKLPMNCCDKHCPSVLHKKEDGSIDTIGQTDMSEGELRALMEQRKVVQARIYHKGGHWHCFYFTFKGMAGEERGEFGSKPHYHYLSDKSGLTMGTLLKRISDCDMPSSRVHIIIERHGSNEHPGQ